MIGGYGQTSGDSLTTTVSLSGYQYSQVRVEAIFHFIDAWSGQTAFLKTTDDSGSDRYLWTDSFDFTSTKNSLNLCGSQIGEGKFS